MPRRRADQLLPLELDILAAGLALQAEEGAFHGFLLASRMAGDGARPLTAHGTLYKALARMAASGMLESTWEDPAISEREGRPRRRLYRVTGEGATALARHHGQQPVTSPAIAAFGKPATS